jgi:hypothetical protein
LPRAGAQFGLGVKVSPWQEAYLAFKKIYIHFRDKKNLKLHLVREMLPERKGGRNIFLYFQEGKLRELKLLFLICV